MKIQSESPDKLSFGLENIVYVKTDLTTFIKHKKSEIDLDRKYMTRTVDEPRRELWAMWMECGLELLSLSNGHI